jgi:hypothetical protein
MPELDPLIVRIKAEAQELLQGVKQSQDSLDGLAGFVEKGFKAATVVAFGLAVKNAAEAVVGVTKQVAAQAERLEQLSALTGLSEQRLQEWGAAFQMAGGNIEDLVQSARTLGLQMINANDGLEESRRAFARLGLEATELGSDTEKAFSIVLEKLRAMPPGFERTAAASQLLGRGAAQLLPALLQDAEAFERAAKEAKDFGAVLTDLQLTQLRQTDDAFDRLALAAEGFGKQVAVAFAPAVKWVTDLTVATTVLVTRGFNQLVEAATTLTARFVGFARAAAEIAAAIWNVNVFSREHWQQVLKNIQAIDAETTAIIAAVRAKEQEQAVIKKTTNALAAQEAQRRAALLKAAVEEIAMRERVFAFSQKVAAAEHAELLKQTDAQIAMRERVFAVNKQIAAAETAVEHAELLTRIDEEIAMRERVFAVSQQQAALEKAQAASFTAFMKTQLQDLVASNVFSLSSIVSTWTSSLAQMIVKGGDLKAAWEATQIALVQTALNTGVQRLANFALQLLEQTTMSEAANAAEIAAHTATETAKTAVTATESAVRLGIEAAANKVMLGGVVATLAGIAAVGHAALATMEVVVTATAAIFAAIAAALAASIVGAPLAPAFAAAAAAVQAVGTAAVVAGAAALEAALGAAIVTATATMATPLQHGGIVTGPTLAMLGEAGPEAVLPLGHGGFMGPIEIEVPLYLDGREVARATARHWPRGMWGRGVPGV